MAFWVRFKQPCQTSGGKIFGVTRGSSCVNYASLRGQHMVILIERLMVHLGCGVNYFGWSIWPNQKVRRLQKIWTSGFILLGLISTLQLKLSEVQPNQNLQSFWDLYLSSTFYFLILWFEVWNLITFNTTETLNYVSSCGRTNMWWIHNHKHSLGQKEMFNYWFWSERWENDNIFVSFFCFINNSTQKYKRLPNP